LLYVMHAGLGLEPLDILQDLSVEGIPSRLDLPNVLNPQNTKASDQTVIKLETTHPTPPLQDR
jgi:hypothetical protein